MLTTNILLGVTLALISSVGFAGNRAFASKPLVKSDPVIPTFLSLLVGVPVIGAVMVAQNQEGTLLQISLVVLIMFAAVGILHFAVGRQVSFTAEKNIGANQAAPVISTQILYADLFAILVLGEKITLGLAGGAGLILLGVALLEVKTSASKRGGNVRSGYLAAWITSVIFGFTPLLIKAGLVMFNYYSSSSFIAYLAGLLFYSLVINPKRAIVGIKGLPKSSLIYYVIAGILAAIGQLTRFAALSLAPIVIVVPLMACHPIFTTLMTRKLAREYESFHARTILAIAVVVVGTIVVSISA